MAVIGYFLSILIGVSLGLMGGGGSILTVPLLVYFFSIDPLLAASYSLIIVGFTSLIGITPYVKDKNIDYKSLNYLSKTSAALDIGISSLNSKKAELFLQHKAALTLSGLKTISCNVPLTHRWLMRDIVSLPSGFVY